MQTTNPFAHLFGLRVRGGAIRDMLSGEQGHRQSEAAKCRL
jgi:hypothetical protein